MVNKSGYMEINDERFSSWMGTHVWGRVKISIYDSQGDEHYTLDMPPEVYEHLKKLIKTYELSDDKNFCHLLDLKE